MRIARQIALLWQTRALRRERLYVTDEVDTALAYMRDIFLPVLPSLYARWERVLRQRPEEFPATGQLDRRRPRRQSERHRRVAAAGAGRAPRRRYWPTIWSAACAGRGAVDLQRAGARSRKAVDRLAEESGDNNPARARRAVSARDHRLLCAAGGDLQNADRSRAAAAALGERRGRIRMPRACARICWRWSSRWRPAAAAGSGAAGALARLIRAVETFGFHLATLDLRQNADVHARVVTELLKVAGVEADYQGAG